MTIDGMLLALFLIAVGLGAIGLILWKRSLRKERPCRVRSLSPQCFGCPFFETCFWEEVEAIRSVGDDGGRRNS